MGRHGDSTTFIYRNPPSPMVIPSIKVQRKILDMAKRKIEPETIAWATKCFLGTVKNIIDRGVVYLQQVDEPMRCPECGGKLIAAPCLRCELLTRNN
jgi:hypothetical protein